MTSLADGLPPEIAAALPPEWRANEIAYWSARPELLAEFSGLWVAFADGAVIAAGPNDIEVLHAATASGRHPFLTRVGAEDEPCRMRRAVFAYDRSYPGEPLPVLEAEFRITSGTPGHLFGRVIPDTGADGTALPWADCQALGLSALMGLPTRIGGVAGSTAIALSFPVWVVLDGQEYPCRLQADFTGRERLLGRNVLNRLDVLFRGPTGEVVLNP